MSPRPRIPPLFRVLALQALGLGATYVLALTFSRSLGPAGFGTYAFLLAAAQVLTMLSSLGLGTASVRFLEELGGPEDWESRSALVTTTLLLTGGMALVLGSAVARGLGSGGELALPAATSWLLPGLVVSLTLAAAVVQLQRGLHRVEAALVGDNVLAPLATLGAFALLLRPGTGVQQALLAWILGQSLAVLWGLGVVSREDPRLRPRLPRWAALGHWLRVGFPLVAANFSHLLLRRMDLLVLGFLAGPRAAGLYAVASRLAQLGNLSFHGLNMLLGPRISRAFQRGERDFFRRELPRQVRLGFALSVALSLFLALGSPWILPLFGPGFEAAAPALLVLLLGQLGTAALGPVGCVAAFTGLEDASARAGGLALLVNLLLDLALIPRLGDVGAALATVFSSWLWYGLLWRQLRGERGIDGSILGGGDACGVPTTGDREPMGSEAAGGGKPGAGDAAVSRDLRGIFLCSESFPPPYPFLGAVFGELGPARGVPMTWVLPEEGRREIGETRWRGNRVLLLPRSRPEGILGLLRGYRDHAGFLREALGKLGQEPVDFLLVRDDPLMAWVAEGEARRRGVPWLFQLSHLKEEEALEYARRGLHGSPWKNRAKGWGGRWLRSRALARADRVLAISAAMAATLAEGGVARERLRVLPEGAEVGPEGPADEERARRRREWLGDWAPEGADLLVYCGTLAAFRGLEILPEILAEARSRSGRDLRLLVLGEGPLPGDRVRLEEHARDLGVGEFCRFPGRVPQEEVRGWLEVADLGLSVFEDNLVYRNSSPIKLLEYLAAGLPVVATAVPSQVEALVSSGAGRAVPHQLGAYVEALLELLDETPEARRARGAGGRAWVEQHRAFPVLAERFLGQLREVLETEPRS